MACVTSVATTVCASTTLNRATAVRARNAPVLVTPVSRLVAFRLPSTPRSIAARATYGNGWNPMTGACGPSYNQRWRGSGQRSFEKWAEQANNNMWFPVDVEETAQEYTFVADVPGLGKNDIKVPLSSSLLVTCPDLPCIVCNVRKYTLHYLPCMQGSQKIMLSNQPFLCAGASEQRS